MELLNVFAKVFAFKDTQGVDDFQFTHPFFSSSRQDNQ